MLLPDLNTVTVGSNPNNTMISVLYVDDEEDLLSVGKLFLEHSGEFRVDVMTSASEALNSPHIQSYSTIISDYQMPGMDGISFLKLIREKYGDIPFILFTGRGHEEVVIEAINNGADFYQQKGGDLQAQFVELSHKIKQVVGKKQAEQALLDSRKELADIIDFLPDSTFVIDANGRIIAWNRAIEELTGIPSSEMMGKGEHAYAIRFYGDPRPVLIDLINEPDETIEQFYPNMYRTGTTITAETMLPLPMGGLIPVLINACPLCNQAGTITGAIESIRDLSGFRKIEEEKNWFGSIVENSVNEIYMFDAVSLRFINANRGARRNLGYTLDELHNLTPLDVKPELTLESFEALISPLRSGETEEAVFFTVHQRKNKTRYPVEVHLQFSSSGDTPVFVAIILDITKRTRSEEALQESELRFRSLIQNSSDIIRILDKEGVIIFDSPSSSIILGYPEGSLIGSKGFDYIHPEDQLRVLSDFRDVCLEQNTHVPTEYRIRRADGTYLYVESIALNRIGSAGIDGIIVTIHPIQKQKMAEMEIRKMADDLSAAYEELASSEEELRQNYIELVKQERALAKSEERFRNMAERSSDLILILDTTLHVIYASPSSRTITGYNPEELIEQSPELADSTIFTPSISEFKSAVQTAMEGEQIDAIEIWITKKDGTAACVTMSVVPVIRDGVLTGAQVSMRDVTRAKKTEIALIESETRYRTLFNDAILGIFRSTPEGQYRDMNPAFAHIAGYDSPAEMMQDINNIQTQLYVRPEDRQTIYKLLSTVGEIRGFETEILHRSGHTIWISINAKGIRGADGDIIWYEGTIEDISSRRKAEIEVARKNDELQASLEELSGAEEELKEQLNEIYSAHIEIKERELKYQQLFEASDAGIALHEIVYDENRIPKDYLFLDANPAFEKITGVDANNLIGRTILEVFPTTEPYWIENYGRVALTGKTTHLENFHHDIGKYFEVTVYSLQNGKIVALIQDASERKRYEIHLRETNAYLDNLISNANVPIIVWDPSFQITRLNHSCELLIGRLEQDVVKKPISILFPSDQIETSMRLIRTTLEGVRWDTLKIDIQHLDGSIKSVIWNSSTIYGADGSTPVATIAQGRDVTNELLLESEKGTAVLQIQENIAKLAILNDGIRNPLTIILLYADQTGNPEIIDNILSQIKQIDEMVSNLDSEWVRSVKILEYLRKHGDLVNEFYPAPSNQIFEPCESVQENNSRRDLPIRKNKLFIEEIQAQLYIILDSIDALIYVTDMETHDLLYLNNVGRRMYGDVIGKKCFKAIHNGSDEPCSFCPNHLLVNKSVPTEVHIWVYYDVDQKRWFESRDRAIRWTNGRIAKLKIAIDITDRKQAEESLRFVQEKFTKAFLSSPDAIIISDAETGKIVEINDAASLIYGYSPDEMNGKSALELGIWLSVENRNEFFNQLQNQGKVRSHELVERRKSGELFNASISAEIITLEKQKFIISTIRDITNRKRNELALLESEENAWALINAPDESILLVQSDGRILYVNETYAARGGHPVEEMIGRSMYLFIPSEIGEKWKNFADLVIKSGEPVHFTDEQTGRILENSFYPIFNDLGDVTRIAIYGRDVTEKLEADRKIAESEEKFRRFAENAQDMLFRQSLPDGTFEFISPASIELTGYRPDEFYADPDLWKRLIDLAWPGYYAEKFGDLLKNNIQLMYEYQIIDRSGKTHWLNQRNVLVTDDQGNPIALEGIITDVTRQKTIEHKLQRSELRFLNVTQNARSWIWELDENGIYTYSSPTIFDILGWKPEEIVGTHFSVIFDPSIRDSLQAEVMNIFSSHEPFQEFITFNQHKNGSKVILKTSGIARYDENGKFAGYSGVDQDITKEKEAEEKLIDSEERYRLLAEHVYDVIWTANENLKLIYISPSVTKLRGFTPEEVLKTTIQDSMTPESFRLVIKNHEQLMESIQKGVQVPESLALELELKCKNGSTIWAELKTTVLLDSNNNITGLIGVTRDINQRRQVENALRKTNLQLSLLTGITRHDILNNISVIYAYLALIEEKITDPELVASLKVMITVTEEIQSQIEFTRVYEELGTHEPQWVQLDTAMPRAFLPDTITLITDLQNVSIFADPMLQKVFFALLDNSIRHGKQVTEIRVSVTKTGDELTVIWKDDGIGVPDREKELIFERGLGKNTGLGLFLVREILSLTGITIRETGVSGRGARFEILVPSDGYRFQSIHNVDSPGNS